MTIQQGTVAAGLVMEVITGTPNSVVAQIGDHSDTVTAPCVDGYLPSVGQTIAVVNDNGEYLAIGSTTGVVGTGVPPAITWPLANSGDQAFQPDGVANNALTLQNAASAVNGVILSGSATAANPTLTLNGPDANIGLTIRLQGGGQLSVANGGSAQIRLDPTPQNAADAQIRNSTLQTLTLGAAGVGGGAADVVLTLFAANNATNNIQMTNSAAGAPQISAIGSSTNIDLNLAPKGTGVIQFGYASVVTSGPTPATLGNTGGGPTTAAQYGWRKTKNSDGTVEFHPVWR